MITNERLIDAIGNAIKADHMGLISADILDALVIDEKDVDEYLGKYCVSRGTEKDIIEYFANRCIEVFESRMSCFECLTSKAYQFLAYEIMSYLVNPSSTTYGSDTLYSSFIDVIKYERDMHCCVKIDDEYFIFDFDNNDQKFRIPQMYLIKFDIEKHINSIEKKLKEHIIKNTKSKLIGT